MGVVSGRALASAGMPETIFVLPFPLAYFTMLKESKFLRGVGACHDAWSSLVGEVGDGEIGETKRVCEGVTVVNSVTVVGFRVRVIVTGCSSVTVTVSIEWLVKTVLPVVYAKVYGYGGGFAI